MLSIFCIYLVNSIASLPLDGAVDPNASSIIPPIPDRIFNTVADRINKSLNPITDYDIHIGKGGFGNTGQLSGSDFSHLGTGMPLKTKDFFDTQPRRSHERPISGRLHAAGSESYNPDDYSDVNPPMPIDKYSSRKQKPYKEHHSQYSPRDSTSTHLEEYANYDSYHDDTEYDNDYDYSDYDDDDDYDDYEDDYEDEDDYSDYAGYFSPSYDYSFNNDYNDKKYSY